MKKTEYLQSVENVFYKAYCKIENNKLLSSIRRGFVLTIPIFMIGAIALVIQNFPITIIRNFITTSLDGAIYDACDFVYDCTFGLASLHILIAITYIYSKNFINEKKQLAIVSCMVALCSYVALLGVESINGDKVLSFNYFNVQNVFSSLIVSFLSTKLFFNFYKLCSKKKYKYNIASDSSFRDSVAVILPMFFTIIVFIFITLFIKYVLNLENFNSLIITLFTFPFKHLGRSIFSGLLILFFQCFFWFFGIHGSNTFESVNLTIFQDVQGEILTKTFFDTFVLMGGCGSAICLLIALLIFSKSKNNKPVIKRAILPMAFNINEIMIFGLPVVLNPTLVIPFIITPLFCLTTSYLSVALGIVPETVQTVMWTTPPLLSGYMATNSLNGTILQLFNITCGIFIYAPFVKMNDHVQNRHYEDMVNEMANEMRKAEESGKEITFLSEHNKYSKTAITTINRLKYDLGIDNINMFYQPLCSHDGKVVSAESLLRWNNGFKMNVYPPLVIKLAKEDGYLDELTKYIINKVLKEFSSLKLNNISVSTNIQSSQLVDQDFIDWVITKTKEYNVPNGMLCLELTEESVFIESESLPSIFEKLNNAGIKISIDDFSMGHTSINYLQDNKFDYVKLDGSITKELSNPRVCDILNSVIHLGNNLGFKVVAEYVETEDQKEKLYSMNCNIYQGYLYSKAIPINEYFTFVKKRNG